MTPSQIIAEVETAWAVPAGAITGPFKIQRTAEARFMAAWLMRLGLGMKLIPIAHALGRKDHGTAKNAIEMAWRRIQADAHFQHHAQRILQKMAAE